MTKNVRLRDVAKKAGVSEMTASRVLRNVADVSEATRKKVQSAIVELGYVPNRIAGGLSSSQVNLVGVVIPSVKSYVFSEVLDGISTALKGTNLRPVFGMTDYDLDVEAEVIRDMLSWQPAGLIVAGLNHSLAGEKLLRNCHRPLVEIMDYTETPIDSCVGISHFDAGFDMAKEIVAKNHQKIAFLGTKMSSDYRAKNRFDGFVAGLKMRGLSLYDVDFYDDGSTIAKGKECAEGLLKRNPDIDCIYCSTDILAIGVMMYCLERGISIPDDLAVAGFNGLTMASGLSVELTTTDSLRFEIGHKAAELIIKRNAGAALQECIKLQGNIRIGASI